MNRIALSSLAATATLAVVAILFSAPARAIPPDRLLSYRFLPRHSVLEQSRPGTESPDILYLVSGTFDLEFSFKLEDQWLRQSAKFLNVDAWAANPLTDAAPLNLDRVLNLSGLEGRQLPVAAPFDVFEFVGKTEDGLAVDLFADVLGPWLRLNGGTTPPQPGGAGVVYQLRALARQRPFTDFNDDDVVDSSDLDVWMTNLGTPASVGDATSLGDADGDGDLDGDDFLAWQQNLGETAPVASLAALGPGSAGVPEPSTFALGLLSAGALAAAKRSQERKKLAPGQ